MATTKVINLDIMEQASFVSTKRIPVAGTTGYYTVHPRFDEEWTSNTEITKVIIAFIWSVATKYGKPHTISVGVEYDGEHDVAVPQAVVANPGTLTIGALGMNDAGDYIITTEGSQAQICVVGAVARNTNDLGGDSEAQPDIWATVLTRISAVEDDITQIKEDMPTKVSDLENDSNFQTGTQVATSISTAVAAAQAETEAKIPTKTSQLTNDSDFQTSTDVASAVALEATARENADLALSGDISTINGKIPNQASTSNQLADKAFVNSSVQTATANFRGNWATWSAVPTDANDYPADYAGSKTPTANDYLVVQDASGYTGETLAGTWRFKYSGDWATNGKAGWHPEYQVNETPLTAAQLAALNSGITAELVNKYNGYDTGKQDALTTAQLAAVNSGIDSTGVTKLGNIEAGAQVNVLEGVKLGGTALTPDANKDVNIPSEAWLFTLQDSTTVTKNVLLKSAS